MPLTIGQNIFSQKVIRNLDRTSRALSTSFERLSSGQRINKAADDVAGLAVAEQLKSKSRIYTRAYQNVNDGISALEIASGTIEQITNLVTKMGELAEQSANGSLSYQQRKSLDQEYQALDKEIRRLSDSTKFNNLSLLTGTYSANSFSQINSVGYGQGNISADGRYAFYDNGTGTITRKDLTTNETISTPSAGYVSGYGIKTNSSGEIAVWYSKGTSGSHLRAHIWDLRTNTVRELTSNPLEVGGVESVAISADGTTVAFSTNSILSSNGTLTGTSTNQSIYTYNVSTGTYSMMISDYFGAVDDIALSADGAYGAVYGHITDWDSVVELHLFESATQTARTLGQIINGDDITGRLGVTNQGKTYFYSNGGYDPGGAGNGLLEYDWGTQQTRSIVSDSYYTEFLKMSVSSDGSYLTFLDSANINGQNPTGSAQAFRYDFLTQSIRQMTKYSTDIIREGLFISGDGNSLLALNGSSYLGLYDISAGDYQLNVETGTGATGVVQSALGAIGSTLRGLGNHLLTTQTSARGALDNARKNIERLGTAQGIIGANLSRLSVAGRVTKTLSDELAEARSRIADADIAQESAQLIKNQILQKSGASLLAQANLVPELALRLLRAEN